MFPTRCLVASLFASAVLVVSTAAEAVELELRNDGLMDNGQAVCQQGFATGDEGAATFTHDAAFRLLRVQFLFCGAETTQSPTLVIYRETGGAVPGQVAHEASYQVTGSSDALSEIDLSGANLQFNAGDAIRVAIRFAHTGAPGLANDTDGTTPGANWIYDTNSMAWAEASSFGVSGDFVIRAVVDVAESGAGGSGGMFPVTSTGTMMTGAGGAGGVDDPIEGADDESCSCRAVGGNVEPSAWLAGLALVGLWRRRRGQRR